MLFQRDNGGVEWIVVGLGNPGKKYESTRHNMGFLAVDGLADKEGFRFTKLRFKAWTATWNHGGKKVLVMKPQTYMNLSGEAVRELRQRFRVPVEKIVVVFDDLDTPEGRIRIKRSGSAGGHNGIKSIIYQLESDAFPRVKIGIGAPEKSDADTKDFVLSNMSLASRKAVEAAPEAVLQIIRQGADFAMQNFNGKNFSEPTK